MPTLAEEIGLVIAATILLFMITSFVAVFLVIHRRRYNRNLREREEMQNEFNNEILKAQLEVKEETLHTISQEIHDNIGQLLSLVKLNLNTITHPEIERDSKIQTSRDLVSQVLDELRNLTKTLNSDVIKGGSIIQSLRFEFDILRRSGVYEIDFEVSGDELEIDPEKQLILFRIAQECIQNIVRHSKATKINCRLSFHPSRLILNIEDNGIGFVENLENQKIGSGLINISHRSKLINAILKINSRPNIGTSIQISVPV